MPGPAASGPILNPSATLIVNSRSADAGLHHGLSVGSSCIDTQNDQPPPWVGVPLISPSELSERPGGSAPESILKMYGGSTPPTLLLRRRPGKAVRVRLADDPFGHPVALVAEPEGACGGNDDASEHGDRDDDQAELYSVAAHAAEHVSRDFAEAQ